MGDERLLADDPLLDMMRSLEGLGEPASSSANNATSSRGRAGRTKNRFSFGLGSSSDDDDSEGDSNAFTSEADFLEGFAELRSMATEMAEGKHPGFGGASESSSLTPSSAGGPEKKVGQAVGPGGPDSADQVKTPFAAAEQRDALNFVTDLTPALLGGGQPAFPASNSIVSAKNNSNCTVPTSANPRLSMRAFMTGTTTWIPQTDEQELRDLKKQPWYFPEATERDAAQRLQQASEEPQFAGKDLFLVRPSIIGYSISTLQSDSKTLRHLEILRLPSSRTFKLMEDVPDASSDDVEFHSVSEVVSQTPLLRGYSPVFVSEEAEKLDSSIDSLLAGLTMPIVAASTEAPAEIAPESEVPEITAEIAPASEASAAYTTPLTSVLDGKDADIIIPVIDAKLTESDTNRSAAVGGEFAAPAAAKVPFQKSACFPPKKSSLSAPSSRDGSPLSPRLAPASPGVAERISQLSGQNLLAGPKVDSSSLNSSVRSSNSLKKLFVNRGSEKVQVPVGRYVAPAEIQAQRLNLLRRPSTAMIGDVHRAGVTGSAPLSGYLTKFGGHGMKTNWRRRYCVMSADGSILQYFKDEKDMNEPVGTIILDSYNRVSDASNEHKKKFCFKISHSEHSSIRPFSFFAESADAFSLWYTRLAEVFQTGHERKIAARAAPDDETARIERSVWLTISEARGLKRKCDSFAVVTAGSHKIETQTIRKTKDPMWGESYEFTLDIPDATVVVSIIDAAKDDVLGRVEIPVFSLKQKPVLEGWYPLVPHEAKHLVTGAVSIAVESNPPTNNSDGRLTVRIIAAKNLSKKKELSATVHWGKNNSRTRKVSASDNDNAINWNEDFTFEVPSAISNDTISDLIVDIYAGDDFCGRALASLDGLAQRAINWRRFVLLGPRVENLLEEKERQDLMQSIRAAQAQQLLGGANSGGQAGSALVSAIALEGRDTKQLKGMLHEMQQRTDNADATANKAAKSLGDVRLKVRYEEQIVLPLSEYLPLLDLLEDPQAQLLETLVEACDQDLSSRELCAKTLCHIGEARGNVERFVTGLCVDEICRSQSTETLFRGNSVATKALDFYQKLVAMPWIRSVLQSHIEKLLALGNKVGWEIDPTRLGDKENAGKNAKVLQELLQSLVDDIFASVGQCPAGLVRVYQAMVKACATTFSQQIAADTTGKKTIEGVQFTTVSSFLVLRLWAPAILGPKLFGLADEHPNEKNGRLLTLCSKTLQTLSNLVPFGPKEPFMVEHLNGFITRNTQPMREFLTTLSNHSSTTMQFALPPTVDVNLDYELAIVQRLCNEQRAILFTTESKSGTSDEREDHTTASDDLQTKAPPPSWQVQLSDTLLRLNQMCEAVAQREADESAADIAASSN